MVMDKNPEDLSQLPLEPSPKNLLAAYQLCRAKLVTGNRSRSSLKVHDERRRKLILDLQKQLNALEASLREEASSRLLVHELNQRITRIVRELQIELDEMVEIVGEKGAGGPSSWAVRMARLLPIALRLRQIKANALSLLGLDSSPEEIRVPDLPADVPRGAVPALDSARQPDEQLKLPLVPQGPSFPPASQGSPAVMKPRQPIGPLVLIDLDYAFGLLAVYKEGQEIREGWTVVADSPLLPGLELYVPTEPEDLNYAPVEAGLEAISSGEDAWPELRPWLERGVLPFAFNEQINQLTLLGLEAADAASHVLVEEQHAKAFEELGATTLPLDLDEERWLGFVLRSSEEHELVRALLHGSAQSRETQPRETQPRLSNRGGVRMPDGQGFLATGLGLPMLGVPAGVEVSSVQLQLADGSVLNYEPTSTEESETTRCFWRPDQQVYKRPELPQGSAIFAVTTNGGNVLQRAIQLTALPLRVRFNRRRPLEFREDWGSVLGPLALQEFEWEASPASEEALQWARQRLNQGDYTVNHLFEQQMLESLCALFQRRPSILRREFIQLYSQLRNKPDEWPGFPEAVLRGWCEGGWIEEGLEQGNGRWLVQPVDPRLVRISESDVQLVGLLSARRLVELLAWAHQLGMRVQAVAPTCPDMARGWRFFGAGEALAAATALPLVEQSEWVPEPRECSWILDEAQRSDLQHWPTGGKAITRRDGICGQRGIDYHWKPTNSFPEGGRAPIRQSIQAEVSPYGRRRWHSRDDVRDSVFSSCHRNRVALHALEVATNGLWPFGLTDAETGQLDRLYDADAYLPLPLARYLALTGNKMPGPTRLKPEDHTYRYHLDRSLRQHQRKTLFLPLTPVP